MSVDYLSDEALMLGYQKGREQDFAALYQRYRQPIYRYVLRQVGTQAHAEEVFQDVWATLIRRKAVYLPTAVFRNYIFCLAHSRLYDFYRRHQKITAHEQPILDDDYDDISCQITTDPLQHIEALDLQARFVDCLKLLPDEQRSVFILKLESGLQLNDIAVQLDVTFEALKSRLRYAQNKLKTCLGDVHGA